MHHANAIPARAPLQNNVSFWGKSLKFFTLATPLVMAVQYLENLSVDGWGIMAAGCVQNQVSL